MNQHYNSILCLGDSYTIGESVPLHESFPYQLVQILRQKNLYFNAPEIVAKTGWTSFELANHLLHNKLNEHYDFVTLLIGVNNQYRELNVEDFKTDFDFLLKKAIHFARNQSNKVIVLSIPDWSKTLFAEKENRVAIGNEIDLFNASCKTIAANYSANFIDITTESRNALYDANLLAKDGLHYSGKMNYKWANKIADCIIVNLH